LRPLWKASPPRTAPSRFSTDHERDAQFRPHDIALKLQTLCGYPRLRVHGCYYYLYPFIKTG
jgi:hypothetical protein